MTFEAYLISKKIDPQKFENLDSTLFNTLRQYFEQVSPNSFTQQKLFHINDIRRKYTLEVTQPVVENTPSTPPIKLGGIKPVFKPKIN